MRPLAVLAALVVAAGCGSQQGSDGDAGTCGVAVQFEPVDAVAPATIIARATVSGASGLLGYTWSVRHDGLDVAVTPRTPDRRDIEFAALEPGVYQVSLEVGGAFPSCPTWQGDVNVRDPGAGVGAVRLRVHPPAAAAPIQERVVVVPGGADFALGTLSVEPGLSTPIAVRDGGGALAPSYVRLRSRATPDVALELVTTAAGTERALLAPGRYDALVVPLVGALAPAFVGNWDPALGGLTVDAGRAVTGRVLDIDGSGLAGARVTIDGDDDTPPSTVATTGADGSFTLAWRGGSGAALTVVPAVGGGRPRLRVPLDTLDAARPLTVRYDAGLVVRDLGGVTARIDGQAVAGGHALVVAELGPVATVGDGLVQVAASGTHRDRIAIDGAGRLAPYLIAAGAARAYLVPDAGGPGAVVVFDTRGGSPPELAGARPRTVLATVVDADGAPVAGAQVTAQVATDLAHLGAPTATATTAADGRVTLSLATGAGYDATVLDRRGGRHRAVISGVAVDLGTLTLAPTLVLTGELHVVGQSAGLEQTAVTALCAGCLGLERDRPLGAAVTDVAGAFSLALPDPTTPP